MTESIQINAAHEVEECEEFRDEMRFVYYQKKFEEYLVRYACGKFILITPQVTRKIVHAMNECNECNECPASPESFRAKVSTPDFF